MKIVFFSDIHGNKYVLEPFMRAIKQEKVNLIIFCGDIFGYYYYQNEIIDIFRQQGYSVLLGNHDQNFLDILDGRIDSQELIHKYGNSYQNIKEKISVNNIEFIRGLMSRYELQIDNYKIGIFHGSPYDNLNGRVYPDTEITEIDLYTKYDFVVLGHTHHKMVKQIEKTTIINPGSIGQQRDGKGCSYLVFDTKNGSYEFRIIEYNIDKLIKDIENYDSNRHKLKEILLRK